MKGVPQDILDVFFEIRKIVHGHIVNAEKAVPIDLEFGSPQTLAEAKDIILKRDNLLCHPRMYLTQIWLALVICTVEEIYIALHSNHITDMLRPLPHFFILAVLVIFYEITIGQLPLQTTVDKLILNPKEYEKKQLLVRHYNARTEAQRKGPRNGLGLIFNSKELEEMYKIKKIPVLIHESIVLALSSLKYKSFDCVGVSALLLLKLIEKNKNYTIKWYYKPGNYFDGHNFIVASDDNGSYIPDLWYDVCTDISQIKNDEFLLQYPLLSLNDKTLAVEITPKDYKYYEGYIRMLNDQLAPRNRKDFAV